MPSFLQSYLPKSQCRSLTQAEVDMAKTVFTHHLYYDNIKLCTAWWVFKGYAVSPNGNIYFHQADFLPCFANQSLAKKSWLIHELTHVWQVQQGLRVVRGAVFDRRYRYLLKAGKHFLHYGIEQQAQMVQDYFVKQQLGQECHDLAECIPFVHDGD